MADTGKSEQPQTNGLENGLDEDERSKMRPADIDADVKEMERRKRVEMIMSSKLFREELERIIELQLKDGNGPAGLLQQISDMMGIQSGKLHTTHMFRGSNCVTPINDIRGVESMGYEKGEKNLRCKLASVFRLMDLYGWSQGINNQITARLNQDEEHFLVNPHGMLFNEITASSLVKVDMQGNIVEPGTTNFSVNTQGFLLHSAIHASRPDVNCVIHIKTPSVLAVSSLKCGLLPICQEALVIGEVSQHPFVSGIFEPEEREKIIRNLGPHNKVLLLHNHGAVCCGATVEEAFYNVYNTVLACETQMKLMPIGVENLLLVNDETRKQVYDAAHRAPDAGASGDKKKFRVGEMEFEALIRMLDNAGFRTGYIYRHPLVKGELPKPKNDVEVPPAVSSLGYLIEQEELYKQGNWKKYIDGRNRLDRTKWLNSPNVYQKVEILETGTSDPKKITKWVDQNSEEWVAESSPTHSSTPVKIDSALQFVPKGTNPKEFKKLQQQIKENRRADKITSGPQSHILEGVSWEEAKKLQDANITQTGDQVILVGAASKGIIQRNYQHNALVYKTPYAKNPFDSMSDKEIEDYKQLVERKQRGDTDYEESQSESEAISSSRQDALRHFKSPLLSPQSATSETEEESRDEPRVLRIETKTAPRPIQAEVVLSDAESDTTDARVERSHSARYPKAEKPESVTLMNSFRKSWSLKREKDKSKDVENPYETRNFLKETESLERTESLHYCVARLKQLTHKPVIVDLGTKSLRPLLKSASDPCNLSNFNDEDISQVDNRQTGVTLDVNTSLSCGNIVNTTELQQRLKVRKKMLHSAKMKFLGYQNGGGGDNNEPIDTSHKSPMRALISEIRETINELMSPERSKILIETNDNVDPIKWTEKHKIMSRSKETNLKLKKSLEDLRNKILANKSHSSLNSSSDPPSRSPSDTFIDFKNEFNVLKMDLENSERLDTSDCSCAIHGGNPPEQTSYENQPLTSEKANASDEEATYTITEDSLLPTYSFTESTETEWYYNKTIMKLENSQTVLEIKETENKEGENLEMPVKYIDTGIDTDFTSDKEVEMKTNDQPVEEQKEVETLETTEDVDNDVPVLESSGLNKSSETDSSFLKSSSGRTSNDVDTSFAFKTETETSDKTSEKVTSNDEKKKFLERMLLKTKEPIEEESSDSEETNKKEEQLEKIPSKVAEIPESPEFTNVDTEDAPITSSSKDTSPEVVVNTEHITENEQKEPEIEFEEEKENVKAEQKKKKNVKSSTKITVKKELKEKDSNEPVVSEIKLTIKNLKNCQSEKYEVKIQDVTNTSEDLSRSVSSTGENIESYESFEIVDKSCDCEAHQNLEELQEEVSSTIEKLQTVENYFEEEIKNYSNVPTQKERNGSDEFTIEYNYREFEEVLNESNSRRDNAIKLSEMFEDVPEVKPNTEFFVSTPLGDICGEIEVCDEGFDVFTEQFEGETSKCKPSGENEMEDLALSSAFVAAILSEAVLEAEGDGNDRQLESFLTEEAVGAEMEVIYKVELPDDNFEMVTEEDVGKEIVGDLYESIIEEVGNFISGEKFGVEVEIEQQKDEKTCQDSQISEELNMEKIEDEKMCQDIITNEELCLGMMEEEEGSQDIQTNVEIKDEKTCQECQTNEKMNVEKIEDEEVFQDCQISEELYMEGEKTCQDIQTNEELYVEKAGDEKTGLDIETNEELYIEQIEDSQQLEEEEKQDIKETTSERLAEDTNDKKTEVKDDDSQQLLCEKQDNKEATTERLDEVTNGEMIEVKDENFQQLEEKQEISKEATIEELNEGTNDQKAEVKDEGSQQLGCEKQDNKEATAHRLDEAINDKMMEVKDENSQQLEEKQEISKEATRERFDEDKKTEVKDEDSKKQVINEEATADRFDEITNEQETEVKNENSQELEEEKQDINPEAAEDRLDQVQNDQKLEVKDEISQHIEEKQDIGEEATRERLDEGINDQKTEVKDEDSEQLGCEKQDINEEAAEDRLYEVQNDQKLEVKDENSQLAEEKQCLKEEAGEEKLGEVRKDQKLEVKGEEPSKEDVEDKQQDETAAKLLLPKDPQLLAITFPEPLKAITYQPEETPIEDIITLLLNTVEETNNRKNTKSVSDVINFIVTNEESPTDSLVEFEDMENLISTSSSVVADIIDSIESQMEGDVESLPDEDELKEQNGTKSDRKKRKKESIFKVTIATADKKEIFINYSADCSSTFNTSSDLDQIEELCNSYIKTDEINEDFDNLSSDNYDFYSVCSSGKNSLNSSFCSVEETVKVEQFCCGGCQTNLKSPRSLAIIQEVDEGDSSASSTEVAAS